MNMETVLCIRKLHIQTVICWEVSSCGLVRQVTTFQKWKLEVSLQCFYPHRDIFVASDKAVFLRVTPLAASVV